MSSPSFLKICALFNLQFFLRNWFWGDIFMCECTAITWEHTWPKKNNTEGWGPHSYGLSQRNIGEDISFSFFCGLYFEDVSKCVAYEGISLSQCADHWTGIGPTSLSSSSSQHAASAVSLWPHPPWIHPSNRKVRQIVRPPLLTSQNLK